MCGVGRPDLVMGLQRCGRCQCMMGGGGLQGEVAGDGGGLEVGGVVSQMKLEPRGSCSTSVLY